MSWRIVFITQPCTLAVSNNCLIYKNDQEQVTIPLEDIAVVIIENLNLKITGRLLSELSQNSIALFCCDQSHLPAGLMLPFHQHSRYAEVAHLQISWTEPFKKRIWQKIVKQKILNQAEVLAINKKNQAQRLRVISQNVVSGDSNNKEAQAANYYWKDLFCNFKRSDDNDFRNKMLDYGYSILRGAVARSIVGSGLLPLFGVHHCNKLNAFALADDFVEPFRPFVDQHIYKICSDQKEGILTVKDKQDIASILTENCYLSNESINILKACEMVIQSLVRAIKNKNANLLILPALRKE